MATFDIVAVAKTIIRSVATTWPAFTPYVNAWNEHEAEETNRRLNLFRDAFIFEAQQNARRFEQAENDVNSMRQQMQVFERAVEAARREPSETKLRALARAAANAMAAGETIPQDDKLTLLEALDTLTETDLTTLGKFSGGRTLRVEKMVGAAFGQQAQGELGRLVASLRKLEARGLLSETSHKGSLNVTGSVGDPDHWMNRWQNKDFEMLPLGQTLTTLLKQQTRSVTGGSQIAPS